MTIESARAALGRARVQFERVESASYEPVDRGDAVMWAFYAYENCVVAVAELNDIEWKRTHPSKVAVARQLYANGVLSIDVGDHLVELNELRKDIAYDEPGEDLQELDLDDLRAALESFVIEVVGLVGTPTAE